MADDKPDDGAGWQKVGGATVHVGAGGLIDKGCEGLVGHSPDPDHLEATRDERDAKQEAAEKAGWQSAESKEAQQLHAHAKGHAPDGTIVLVRIGDKLRAFGEDAYAMQHYLGMGDGRAAEFNHEQTEDHLKTLVSHGYRVAIVERTGQGGTRPQAEVGPEHAAQLDTDAGDTASDPGREPQAIAGRIGPPTPAPVQPKTPALDKRIAALQAAQKTAQEAQQVAAEIDARRAQQPGASVPPVGQQPQPGRVRGRGWTHNPFAVEKHPETERAAQAVDGAPPKPKNLIQTMHGLDDVKTTGAGTAKLAPGYAEAMHDHLATLPNGTDGFGTVHDLSDHLGPGAIGYHSPAGIAALVPPKLDGDKWEARYNAQHTQSEPDPFDEPGDSYEPSDHNSPEADAKAAQELEPIKKAHPDLHAAVADAFPGDVHSQLAAAEMAVAAWKPYAEQLQELKTGRAHLISAISKSGIKAAQLKQALLKGHETQKAIRGFDQLINDYAAEFPAMFNSYKMGRDGILRSAGGSNLDSDREAALLENLGWTNDQLTPPSPAHPEFLGAAINDMSQPDEPVDESIPFSRRAYYQAALKRYHKHAKEGVTSEHPG